MVTGKLGRAWYGAWCMGVWFGDVLMWCGGGGGKNAWVYYLDW